MQCCHSKKLKTQDWAIKKPRKPKVKFLYVFEKFLEKIALFLKKSKLFLKKCLFIRQIFYPDFSNFDHFSPKMSYFLQKTKKMYFRANFKKTQEKPKVLSKTLEKTQGPQKKTQEPKIASKNPRSWEKTQAVATLYIYIYNRL